MPSCKLCSYLKHAMRCKAIFIFDLVHDKIKMRVLTPFVIVFILFIIVSSIFASLFLVSSFPQNLNVIISPPKVLSLKQIAKLFIVQITDQNFNPSSGLTIDLIINDLIVIYENEIINCDFTYLSQHFWTYEFIRGQDPCSIHINGSYSITDSGGYAYFNYFSFTQAPQGSYYIYFQIHNYTISSSKYNILLSPIVYSISVLNNPPQYAEINVPLNVQPQLQLFDLYGNPLPDSFATAISYPFGDFQMATPQLFDPDVDKFAYLTGKISNPSNSSGHSMFSNLTIVGSTHLNVYILFVPVGNNKFISWKIENRTPELTGTFKFRKFISPIQIIYKESHFLNYIQDVSPINMEGVSFSQQPIIQIENKENHKPIQNIICFALLRRFHKFNFPNGYQPHYYMAFPKSIIFAITGNYFTSSEGSLKTFEHRFSNENGIIFFQNLTINREGTNYLKQAPFGIVFSCGNNFSVIHSFILNSSVKLVEIINPPSFGMGSRLNIDSNSNQAYYTVYVEDFLGNPLSNKMVNSFELTNINSNLGMIVKLRNFNLLIPNNYNQFSLNSNYEGIIEADLFIYQANYIEIDSYYNFSVTIDGISNRFFNPIFIAAASFNVIFTNCLLALPNITGLQEVNLTDTEFMNIPLVFLILDGTLFESAMIDHAIFDSAAIFNIYSFFETIILFYIYQNLNRPIINDQDQRTLHYMQLNFSNIFTGTYIEYIFTHYYLGNYKIDNPCYMMDPLIIQYTNSINKVEIVEPQIALLEEITLAFDQPNFLIILKIYDKDNLALSNFKVNIMPLIYEYPPHLAYFLIKDCWSGGNCLENYLNFNTLDGSNIFNIINESESKFTDNDGKYSFVLQLQQRFRGNYVISILVNGISSIAFRIRINAKIQSLKIRSAPSNSNTYFILAPMNDFFSLQINTSNNAISELANVSIVAYLNISSLNPFLDVLYDINPSLVLNPQRINFTNSEGIANFTDLRILAFDNSDSSMCIEENFYFITGLDYSIISAPSPQYTFCIKNFSVFANSFHDTKISLYRKLDKPIIFSYYESIKINSIQSINPIKFIIMITNYNYNKICANQTHKFSLTLFNENYCIIQNMTSFNQTCSTKKMADLITSDSKNYQISFNNLHWKLFTNYKHIDLVECIYNMCNYSSASLIRTELTNVPRYLNSILSYPISINLGEYILSIFSFDYIPYIMFECNIASESGLKREGNTISRILNLLFEEQDLPKLYNSLSQESRILLNESFINQVSRKNGFVTMKFSIIEGKSGNYFIECQTEKGMTISSTMFTFVNYIDKIKIINDHVYNFQANFKINLGNIMPLNITFGNDIILEITFIEKRWIQDLKDSINIEIYDSDLKNEALNMQANDDSVTNQIRIFWDVLTEGASALNAAYKQVSIQVFYDKIVYDEFISQYYIKNLTVEFPIPNTYWMLLVSKGIETNFSQPIFVNQINYSNLLEFLCHYSIYIYTISVVFIIFSNSNFAHIVCLYISSILLILNIIVFTFSSQNGVFELIIGILLLSITLLFALLQLIFTYKFQKNSTFYYTKQDYCSEYSCRKMAELIFSYKMKVIESNAKKRTNRIHPLNMKLSSNLDHNKGKKINQIFIIVSRSFKNILQIFSSYNTDNCIYYPQRLIMAIFLAVFVLIYCIFQVTSTVFSLIDTFMNIQKIVTANIFVFINSIQGKVQSKFNEELTGNNMEIYYNAIQKIITIQNDLQNSMKVSVIITNIIISIIFLYSLKVLLQKFNNTIIKSRGSKKIIEKYKGYDISEASDLSGLMIGNTSISYLISATLLFLILSFVFNKYFWIFIWEIRLLLLYIIIPILIKFILDFFIPNLIFKNNMYIGLPIFLQLYEIYSLVTSLLGGIASSFERAICGLVIFFISIIRFDKSINPKWNIIPFSSDDIFESFNGYILMNIIYNNPIFIYMSRILGQIADSKHKKVVKKLHLAFLLRKFPKLRKSRKSP